MATTYVSAGVYINEKDDSLYTPAASPTIVGLIGTATKGVLNTATFITNEGQLIDTFGRPRTKDRAMHSAIEILKSCRTMYFVRIGGASLAYGAITVDDTGSTATAASIGPSANGETFNLTPGATVVLDVNATGDGTATFTATQAARECATAENYDLNAIAAGAPVTLTIAIDGAAAQTITFASTDPLIALFNAVTAEEATAVINDQILGAAASATTGATKVTVTSDTYGTDSIVQVSGGTANPAFGFNVAATAGTGNVGDIDAVTALEVKTVLELAFPLITVTYSLLGAITLTTNLTGASASLDLDSSSTAIGASPLINLTPLDSLQSGSATGVAASTVTFTAATQGTHSSDIDIIVSDSTSLTNAKKLVVRYRDVTVETYDKLYKGPVPLAGAYEMITTINAGTTDGAYTASEYITAADANAALDDPANGTYTLTAGNNGDDWIASTVIGTVSGTTYTGMQVFSNPEEIDVSILATPGISYASVISAGITLAAARADCLFVADCPFGLSPAEVTGWHNGDGTTNTVDQESRTEANSTAFNSSYAALYYPFVQIYDKYNDSNVWMPPSMVAVRTMVHTDQVGDPWIAAAGPNRSQTTSILQLEYSATQGERDLMYQSGNNVNPLASIVGVGVTIMGQKTLQRAPTALDRVNVRRLLLFLEKAIARSTKYLMFEQNDEVMWRRFINLVTPLLDDVKARRGMYDYRVVADSSTTTDSLIDNNTFVGKIFIQPTKTAEILIVSFNLLPSGASFEEYVQA
jgi:phage tail sheath protein FI